MIKIAYIIDTIESPSAGTEQQLLMLLNNLDRDRFSPYLICLRDSPWLKSQSFNFPVYIFNIRKIFSLGFVHFIRQFNQLHKIEKFDIVQTFFADANIVGVIAAKMAGVKVILASRRNIGDTLTNLQLYALRIIKRYTKKFLANSRAAARKAMELEGIKPERIEVIYNGLYLDKFRLISPELRARQRTEWGISEDDILIGLIANLRPVKNIEALIEAAYRLTGIYPNLKFVVVGEGQQREDLQKRINIANLGECFKLVGRYGDIVPCLAAFDVAVLCSKAEGFSNSLIEYMAAGLPSIASDVGGNAEAISHKESGIIYSSNDPDGLTNGLSYLIENKEIAREYGQKARAAAMKKYDVTTYVKNHEEFYSNLINNI